MLRYTRMLTKAAIHSHVACIKKLFSHFWSVLYHPPFFVGGWGIQDRSNHGKWRYKLPENDTQWLEGGTHHSSQSECIVEREVSNINRSTLTARNRYFYWSIPPLNACMFVELKKMHFAEICIHWGVLCVTFYEHWEAYCKEKTFRPEKTAGELFWNKTVLKYALCCSMLCLQLWNRLNLWIWVWNKNM